MVGFTELSSNRPIESMSWFFTPVNHSVEEKRDDKTPPMTTLQTDKLTPHSSRESRKELHNRIALNIPKLELKHGEIDNTDTEDSGRSRYRSISTVSESSYDEILSETTNVKSKYLQAVIISVWDNTLGPKTLKVWHGSEYDRPDEELIKFVTQFPLFGEVGREEDFKGNIRSF